MHLGLKYSESKSMRKKSIKAKSIVVETSDKITLIPGVSLGPFKIGSDILSSVASYDYKYTRYDDGIFICDEYEIDSIGIRVSSYDNSGVIDHIESEISCYYNGIELINLSIDDFMDINNIKPDTSSTVRLDSPPFLQHQYCFYDIDMYVWTHKRKIISVSVA